MRTKHALLEVFKKSKDDIVPQRGMQGNTGPSNVESPAGEYWAIKCRIWVSNPGLNPRATVKPKSLN